MDTKYRISGIAVSGEYYFLVRAVDNAGNIGEWKIIALYRFDKDNPDQTTTGQGVIGWTNQSAHTFNWDPVADLSGIDHYDAHWSQAEGTSVTHQTAGAAYTASGLSASGIYYLRVRAVDGAGNTGEWKTIATYKYDGAAPDFTPQQATLGWTTQKDCGAITWTAANDGAGSGVAGYNIYWGKDASGAAALARQTGNDEAARSYNPLPCDAGDGVYYLRAQAVDNAGNAGEWKTVLVYRYDAGAPVLSFTSTQTEFSDVADRGEFVWAVADDGAGSGVAGYYVYWGVNPSGTTTNWQTGTAFDPPPCEEYTYYYLRVQAVDNIGNAGEWKTLLSYAFNSSDKPGVSLTDEIIGWTNNANPEAFTWSSASSGGPAISGYYVYWGTDSEGRNPDNYREGNGTLERTYDPPACSEDGFWYLRVQAQNAAGNKGAWTTVLTYKYDATPPGISPTQPDTDIDWSGHKQPEPFTWEPALDGRGSGVAGYQVYWGLKSNGVSTDYLENNTFVIPELTEDGKYYLRVRAIDTAGNVGSWTPVYKYWYDGSAPLFAVEQIDDPWTINPDRAVVSWDEALDGGIGENAGSGVAGYNIYWGDDPSGNTITLQRSRDNRQYDPPPCLTGDPHYLRIQAVDNVGNASEWQTVLVYRYDNLPPGISPTNVLAERTNNPYPGVFTWAEADDGRGSGINGYYVYWGDQPDGEDNSAEAYQNDLDKNSYEPSMITSGSGVYYLRVKAKDNVDWDGGWTSVLTYPYYFTTPGISATNEISAWTNEADPPRFEWQEVTDRPSGLSGYNIYWGQDAAGAAALVYQAGNDAAARGYDPAPCAEGNGVYYLRVQAIDDYGALGEWSTVYTYRYESAAPSGSIMINVGNPEYMSTTNVALYLDYTDEHSGVVSLNLKIGDVWQGWEAAALIKQIALSAEDGEKTVSVRYRDAAGNISPEYTDSIILNMAIPASGTLFTLSELDNGQVTISWITTALLDTPVTFSVRPLVDTANPVLVSENILSGFSGAFVLDVSRLAPDNYELWGETDGAAYGIGVFSIAKPQRVSGSGGTGEKVWSYPNPFSPDNGQEARLAYVVDKDGWTKVYVYDARGRRVWQTENYARADGDNIVLWDGRNNQGRLAANGLYVLIVTDEKGRIISKGRLALYDE
jgi:hypothetical protein